MKLKAFPVAMLCDVTVTSLWRFVGRTQLVAVVDSFGTSSVTAHLTGGSDVIADDVIV